MFKLMGFSVRVDPSWFFLAFLVTWTLATGFFPFTYPGLSYAAYLGMGMLVAVGLFFSVLIHEFAHARVGKRFGLPMHGITLFIFGGVAEMAQEAPNPKVEFLVALAGPLTSVLLSLLFWGLTILGQTWDWPVEVTGVTSYMAFMNGFLVLFNMVPAFPLDGGRVLRAVLWQWKDNIRWATRITSRLGGWFGIGLMVWGLLDLLGGNLVGGIWRILIGLFLKNAADMSYRQLLLQTALAHEPILRFVRQPSALSPELPVRQFLEAYPYGPLQAAYPVVADGKLLGCVTLASLKQLSPEQRMQTLIGDVMQPCASEHVLPGDISASEALSRFNARSRQLLVTDGDRLLGMVSMEDLLNFVSTRQEMEKP